jgi:hypothetical protein
MASTPVTNVFWIGANVLFDLQTGETKQVLQFVFREEDATTLTEASANTYISFIQGRAANYVGNTTWHKEPSTLRRGLFVIKGVQEVAFE